MPHAANLTSIDVPGEVKAALVRFDAQVQDAIIQLNLAARRPLEWLEHDRSRHWPREVRKAADAVSEARQTLARAQATIDPDNHRACYEERKLLDKAKRRLELAERKSAAVRRWIFDLQKEIEEFAVQSAKLQYYLESDLPKSLAALTRMAGALDHYVQPGGASGPACNAEAPA